ncbi:MAG: sulfatase-like hydrolase/transferase [Verrucomicrobiota bacterium]
MVKLFAVLFYSLCFSLVSTHLLRATEEQKPNIILYLSDDLGYADLAFMGHPYAKTPHLDSLAKQGAVFMQHYVSGVTCAPSRAGIMTGRHSARYQKYPADFGYGDRATITSLLSKHGYTTAHFGKWHMGPDESVGTYGYDEIFAESNNRNAFNTPSRDKPLTDKAIEFIQRMAKEGKPFYANVWGHSTHYPIRTYPEIMKEMGDIPFNRSDFSETIQERFDRSESWKPDLKDSMTQYVADVYGIDKNMGRIMQTLEQSGIAKNTILVFSSDHGPQNENRKRDYAEHMLGYTGHLKGYKGNQFEGGVRVPFMIRWPAKIQAGRVDTESVTSFIDWLPTLSRIVGIKSLPEGLDGEDISDIWLKGPRDRKTNLYWKTSNSKSRISIRSGQWKYHQVSTGDQLYDLIKDPGEKNDLSQQYPEVLSSLATEAKKWGSTLPATYEKKETRKKKDKKKKSN